MRRQCLKMQMFWRIFVDPDDFLHFIYRAQDLPVAAFPRRCNVRARMWAGMTSYMLVVVLMVDFWRFYICIVWLNNALSGLDKVRVTQLCALSPICLVGPGAGRSSFIF